MDDQPYMSSSSANDASARRARGKSTRRKRKSRRRRLTDKIRAALARAATLGRRDVVEQLGTLYQERVEEELARDWKRRSRDPGFKQNPSRRRS